MNEWAKTVCLRSFIKLLSWITLTFSETTLTTTKETINVKFQCVTPTNCVQSSKTWLWEGVSCLPCVAWVIFSRIPSSHGRRSIGKFLLCDLLSENVCRFHSIFYRYAFSVTFRCVLAMMLHQKELLLLTGLVLCLNFTPTHLLFLQF